MAGSSDLASEFAQLVHRAVEVVLIAGQRPGVGELPDGVPAPALGQRADVGVVARYPQWTLAERAGVAGAQLPPAGRGADDRQAAGEAGIRAHECADPAAHLPLAQPVALVLAVRAVFPVQRAGQGAAVIAPIAAVSHEVLGLGTAAAHIRASEVVGAADQAHPGGTVVLLREMLVAVSGALGGLDVAEFRPLLLHQIPVDLA